MSQPDPFGDPIDDDDPYAARDPHRVRQDREAWLAAIRRRVRDPPRRLGMGAFFGPWSVPRPPWLDRTEPLAVFYRERRRMLARGVVVWAAIVQANKSLFAPADHDAPAEFVYAPDPTEPVDPGWLLDVASDLFALKGRADLDAELQPIADHLTNERTYSFGRLVPRSYIAEHAVALTSALVFRRHLPGKRLTGRLVPLLVADEAPRVAMIVPQRFWPGEMRKAFAAGTL